MAENEKTEKSKDIELDGTLVVYELGYHLLPILSEDDVSEEVKNIKTYIEKQGGTIIVDEAPKLTDLAYTMIKKIDGKNVKFDSSFFGWVKFEGDATLPILLKEEVDQSKGILRFIILKTVREYTPIQHKQMFRQHEEEAKPIKKPEVVEDKGKKVTISDEELDKSIEELVA